MTAVVFVGPTLSREDLESAGDFSFLPPVAQGDVYRAAKRRPRAIGLIDGIFEGLPSVWHKEILWAMSQGIHVFGAASMGALRAAELHVFGMRGVGEIFAAYNAGSIEDDDEVAVLHGPPEAGYLALSEALVNIRATLAAARASGIVAEASRARLESEAKRMYYKIRTWDALLERAAETDIPPSDLAGLRDWLPAGRVDLKAADARTMLAAMRDFLANDPPPATVSYDFEWTHMWDVATTLSESARPGGTPIDGTVPADRLLDELRLDEAAYRRAYDDAFVRVLALREAERQHIVAGPESTRKALNRFRARFGLFRRSELDDWLADNGLSSRDFERLLQEDVRIDALKTRMRPLIEACLVDGIAMQGAHAHYSDRARRKHELLAERGLDVAEPGDVGLTPAQLVARHFEERLGRPVPEDLQALATELGLAGKPEFYRLLLREHIFLSVLGDPADEGTSGG